MTKEEFWEYYNRSLCMNLSVCEDADFDIIDGNICVNLSKIKDETLIIPDFVDGIYGDHFYNLYLRDLDLNKVKIIYESGLLNYHLTSLKGDELREIRSYGLSNNGQIMSLELPKLEYLAYRSLDRCVNLAELKAESLLEIDNYVFSESFIKKIYAPNIKYVGYLADYIWTLDIFNLKLINYKIIDVDFGDFNRDDLFIKGQYFRFHDINKDIIYNYKKEVLLENKL